MNDKSVILFDGVCNLCNSSVNLIIKHDPKNKFMFGAIQSDAGQNLIKKYNIDPKKTDSIILIKNNKAYVKSTAALKIAKQMSGAYPLLYIFMVLPLFIRNWVYDFIAKNRYQWYGKKDHCMIPTKELKQKFLN